MHERTIHNSEFQLDLGKGLKYLYRIRDWIIIMPERTYKDYKIYGCLALNRLISALGIDIHQDNLEEKIDRILENDKTRISKEEIKHEIKSNHYMTNKVLKKLEEDELITIEKIKNRYNIRITKTGILHAREFNRFYAEMYRKEIIEHYRYGELPYWFRGSIR
jgi:predicted transcriptional regulator